METMLSLILVTLMACGAAPLAADTPYVQEYHEAFPFATGKEANDVRCVAVGNDGQVFTGTMEGLFKLDGKDWTPVLPADGRGPVFDIAFDEQGRGWVAAWNGLWILENGAVRPCPGTEGPLGAVGVAAGKVWCGGPEGVWECDEKGAVRLDVRCSGNVRALWPTETGGWVATGAGLWYLDGKTVTRCLYKGEVLTGALMDVTPGPEGAVWAGGLGGLSIYTPGKPVRFIETKDGLPAMNVQSVDRGPDGRMWIGTDVGLARFDGTRWTLLHSRRWLLDDEVRDVAFGADGTAWVATKGGVSAIRQKKLALSEKADYFHTMIKDRHVREPFIVEKCRLPKPGDLSEWKPMDDDNDGGYTAVYMTMECYRYAATKNPEAKQNARRAFETLLFLQRVTETNGFFARTVVPADWDRVADGNRTYTEQERAAERIEDVRSKPVEQRWRPSKDGKWLWKGDTSSDEMVAQMYGCLYYFDLAADDTEKKEVRDLVCRIVDHIIDNGYVLKDIDGKHTRWGVWAPERLNDDPNWAAERNINSTEILSFLKLAHHVSGDEKYQREYMKLVQEHHYAENARHAKVFNRMWRTHIDDELLAMTYPALMLYETDPALKAIYRESLDAWYGGVSPDQSPYFDFLYASLTGGTPPMERDVFYLRDAPLDCIDWSVDNTKREDLTLVREPEIAPMQISRMLPPSERPIMRWDKNPWEAMGGGEGATEWAPVYWLLPYWMGRYYGYF